MSHSILCQTGFRFHSCSHAAYVTCFVPLIGCTSIQLCAEAVLSTSPPPEIKCMRKGTRINLGFESSISLGVPG